MTENVIASTLEQVKICCARSNENGKKKTWLFSVRLRIPPGMGWAFLPLLFQSLAHSSNPFQVIMFISVPRRLFIPALQ
jgi:hypothetical protein